MNQETSETGLRDDAREWTEQVKSNDTSHAINLSIQAGLGTHVQVELVDEAGNSETVTFDIVPDAQADLAHGFLGDGTRLAKAILGQTTGSVVPYRVGDMAQVRILSVTLDVRAPSADIQARREAVLQQARAQSERISDMAFALAVGSKWGDYDPGEAKEE